MSTCARETAKFIIGTKLGKNNFPIGIACKQVFLLSKFYYAKYLILLLLSNIHLGYEGNTYNAPSITSTIVMIHWESSVTSTLFGVYLKEITLPKPSLSAVFCPYLT